MNISIISLPHLVLNLSQVEFVVAWSQVAAAPPEAIFCAVFFDPIAASFRKAQTFATDAITLLA